MAKKKSREYWKDRSLLLEQSLHDIGDEYYHKVAHQYDVAAANIGKEIDRFYGRFAKENELTFADAQKVLTGGEKQAYQMSLKEYTKKAKAYPLSKQYRHELENASVAWRTTRLQSLQLELKKQADELTHTYNQLVKEMASKVYTEGYYRQTYELQTGLEAGYTFDRVDPKKVESLVSKPWTADNKTFSERIWKDKRAELVEWLENDFSNILITSGQDKAASALKKKFGAKKSDALRLIETENAYFTSISLRDSYKDQRVREYEIMVTLDEVTSEVCRDIDKGQTIYPIEEYEIGKTAPPFHVRCRTTSVPRSELSYIFGPGRRAARNKEGTLIYVPGNITYEEYKRVYIDSDIPQGALIEKMQNPSYNDIQEKLRQFEKEIVDQDYESAVVITKDGLVFRLDGKTDRVYPESLGNLLEGSYVTHNHPAGETGFSFSNDDYSFFKGHKLAELRGVDETYEYTLRKEGEMKEMPLRTLHEMTFDWNQHQTTYEAARKDGFFYERTKRTLD